MPPSDLTPATSSGRGALVERLAERIGRALERRGVLVRDAESGAETLSNSVHNARLICHLSAVARASEMAQALSAASYVTATLWVFS